MNKTEPLLAVVIVSWNRRDDLDRLLRSIERQDRINLHVVVVDNGSADGTAEMLRSGIHPNTTVYFGQKNIGAAVARNIGLRLARGAEFVAFLDSDAELIEPDTLRKLTEYLQQNPKTAAVAPAIYSDPERTKLWLLGAYMDEECYLDYDRCLRDADNPHFLSTCVSVWRMNDMEQIGGFDPAYPFGFEDFDLSVRTARITGGDFAVMTDVRCIHHISKSGRPRAYATWEHQYYVERTTQRHRVLQLGAPTYLRSLAHRCLTRSGLRRCRHLHGGLHPGLWRLFILWYLVPVQALLNLPRYRRETAAPDYINQAPFNPALAESFAHKHA